MSIRSDPSDRLLACGRVETWLQGISLNGARLQSLTTSWMDELQERVSIFSFLDGTLSPKAL